MIPRFFRYGPNGDDEMTTLFGTVGPSANADGSSARLRMGKTGDLITTDGLPRYYEMASRGMIWTASNVAAQAVSVALATTYTGLCISNPAGNTKNLVMLSGQYALSVAPVAIASLHLIAGYSSAGVVTHTTPLAAPGIQSSIINGAGGASAKADSAATVVNPYYLMGLGSGFTAGALYATTPGLVDFGGQLIIPPGGWIAWGALTAVTGFGSFTWAEVPI